MIRVSTQGIAKVLENWDLYRREERRIPEKEKRKSIFGKNKKDHRKSIIHEKGHDDEKEREGEKKRRRRAGSDDEL